MKFSVIVPVYNTAAYLSRCVSALLAQDYPRSQFEILCIDNNSTDESLRILNGFDGIRVFNEPQQSSYAARNRGVAEARGEWLAFTDSDCIASPNWLQSIEKALSDPSVHVVLGRRRPLPDTGASRLIADYENSRDSYVFNSPAGHAYYGYTNNQATRASTMRKYGPFIVRPRGSDTIFVRRVVEGESHRAVIYAPDMLVHHAELDSPRAFLKKNFVYGRSRKLHQHITASQPLTASDRHTILMQTLRAHQYTWRETATLLSLLGIGLTAWTLGHLTARHAS